MRRYQTYPVAALQSASVKMVERSLVPLTQSIPPNQKMVKAKALNCKEFVGFMTLSSGKRHWSHRNPGLVTTTVRCITWAGEPREKLGIPVCDAPRPRPQPAQNPDHEAGNDRHRGHDKGAGGAG